MKITLTNNKIYTYAIHIKEFCDERAESLMPARCSFYIYKNLNTLIEAAGCIDKARQNILEKYGTQQDEDKFNIADRPSVTTTLSIELSTQNKRMIIDNRKNKRKYK